MYPPQHICKAVARLHPSFRIGWMGRSPEDAEELNPGAFALIKLRPKYEVGTIEDPKKALSSQWDVEAHDNLGFGNIGLKRVTRGPLFNANGGLKPDWDPNEVRPLIVQVFDEGLDFSAQDIFSGRFLLIVRVHAERQIYKMRRAHALGKGKDADNHLSDMAGEMTDYLWHEAKKAEHTHMDMAWKHAKHNLGDRFINFKEKGAYRMNDYFLDRMGYRK